MSVGCCRSRRIASQPGASLLGRLIQTGEHALCLWPWHGATGSAEKNLPVRVWYFLARNGRLDASSARRKGRANAGLCRRISHADCRSAMSNGCNRRKTKGGDPWPASFMSRRSLQSITETPPPQNAANILLSRIIGGPCSVQVLEAGTGSLPNSQPSDVCQGRPQMLTTSGFSGSLISMVQITRLSHPGASAAPSAMRRCVPSTIPKDERLLIAAGHSEAALPLTAHL